MKQNNLYHTSNYILMNILPVLIYFYSAKYLDSKEYNTFGILITIFAIIEIFLTAGLRDIIIDNYHKNFERRSSNYIIYFFIMYITLLFFFFVIKSFIKLPSINYFVICMFSFLFISKVYFFFDYACENYKKIFYKNLLGAIFFIFLISSIFFFTELNILLLYILVFFKFFIFIIYIFEIQNFKFNEINKNIYLDIFKRCIIFIIVSLFIFFSNKSIYLISLLLNDILETNKVFFNLTILTFFSSLGPFYIQLQKKKMQLALNISNENLDFFLLKKINYALFCYVVLIILNFICGSYALNYLFSNNYIISDYFLFQLLLICTPFHFISILSDSYYLLHKKEKLLILKYGLGTLVNLSLCFLLNFFFSYEFLYLALFINYVFMAFFVDFFIKDSFNKKLINFKKKILKNIFFQKKIV